MNQKQNNYYDGLSSPEGYFESSADRIKNKIDWLEEHRDYLSLVVKKQPGFTLPPDYFQHCLFGMELLDTALLDTGKKLNVFTVPEGYFDKTTHLIKEKNLAAPSFPSRIIRLKMIKYAVAAMLFLTVGMYVFTLYDEERDCGTIACIDREEILGSKVVEMFENDELFEVVDADLLEQNIKSAGIGMGDSGVVRLKIEDK